MTATANCRYLLALVFCILYFVSVYGQTASFTPSDTLGCAPFSVNFTNTSTGAVSYSWDFDDGLTSTQTHPNHTFYGTGNHTVWLYSYDSLSNVDSISMTISIPATTPYFLLPPPSCPSRVLQFTVLGNYDSDNSVQWNFGDGFIASSSFAEHAYAATGDFTVTMTVTNSNCGTVMDSAQIEITDTIIPEVHVHSYGTGTNICPGENFPFFYDEDLSIFWDFGDGVTSTDPYPVHSYDSVGNHTVSISVTNECGNTGTIDTIITVSNNVVPFVSFSKDKLLACPNEFIKFTGGAGFGYTYFWEFDAGTTADGQVVTHSFAQTGIHTIDLFVTNECGNSDSTSGTITITDTLTPVGWMYISDKTICPGTEIQLIAQSGHAQYVWDFGDGNTDSIQTISYTYNNVGTYPIQLTLENECGNSVTYFDTVIVDPTFSPTASFSLSQLTYCPGSSVQFNYDGSSDAVNYFWNFGDTSTDTLPNPTHAYSDTGIYSVTLITTNACNKTDTFINPITINSSATALAAFEVYPDINVCPSTLLSFVNLSSDTGNCFWDFGDGTTSTTPNPTHIYSSGGNYLVKLTATNNCGNSSIITQLVIVSSANEPLVSIVSTDASLFGTCDGSAVLSATGGMPPYTYQWSTGATESSIVGLCASTYFLTLTDANGCTAIDSAIVSQPVGTDELTVHNSKFTVFPNPNNGRFELRMNNEELRMKNYELKVSTLLGETIFLPTANRQPSTINIDISTYSKGIYLVVLQYEKEMFMEKVVVY